MKKVFSIILCVSALIFGCQRDETTVSVLPKPTVSVTPVPEMLVVRTGPVEDEADAIKIALDAWIPIYGRKQIEEEKPFVAKLKNGIWTVEGSLPEGWVGGVAIARISQKDGSVLETGHGE